MTEIEKKSYMERRDTLIEVLESLRGHWELAEGLMALIGSGYVTPELIDGIETLLREAIKTTKDATAKEKIQGGLDRIEAMKQREIEERQKEASHAEDHLLENLIL